MAEYEQNNDGPRPVKGVDGSFVNNVIEAAGIRDLWNFSEDKMMSYAADAVKAFKKRYDIDGALDRSVVPGERSSKIIGEMKGLVPEVQGLCTDTYVRAVVPYVVRGMEARHRENEEIFMQRQASLVSSLVGGLSSKLGGYVVRLVDGDGWNEDSSKAVRGVKNFLENEAGGPSVEYCMRRIKAICDGNSWMDGFIREADSLARQIDTNYGKDVPSREALFRLRYEPGSVESPVDFLQGQSSVVPDDVWKKAFMDVKDVDMNGDIVDNRIASVLEQSRRQRFAVGCFTGKELDQIEGYINNVCTQSSFSDPRFDGMLGNIACFGRSPWEAVEEFRSNVQAVSGLHWNRTLDFSFYPNLKVANCNGSIGNLPIDGGGRLEHVSGNLTVDGRYGFENLREVGGMLRLNVPSLDAPKLNKVGELVFGTNCQYLNVASGFRTDKEVTVRSGVVVSEDVSKQLRRMKSGRLFRNFENIYPAIKNVLGGGVKR